MDSELYVGCGSLKVYGNGTTRAGFLEDVDVWGCVLHFEGLVCAFFWFFLRGFFLYLCL